MNITPLKDGSRRVGLRIKRPNGSTQVGFVFEMGTNSEALDVAFDAINEELNEDYEKGN